MTLVLDQEIRNEAIHTHAVSINVEAGAGTGKTTLLAQRYISILKKQKASPLEVVAITFTEKAAYELKTRIRSELEAKKQTDFLNLIPRAPISTIHSFCASILRERPIEAGLDPNFEVLDELGHQIFIDETYKVWFGKTLEQHAPVISRALSSGIMIQTFIKLAKLLYRHREWVENVSSNSPPADVQSFIKELAPQIETLWVKAQNCCKNESDAGFIALRQLHRTFQTLLSASVSQAERSILLQLSIPTTKGSLKNYSPASALKEIKETLSTLSEQATEVKNRIRKNIFSDLLSILKDFVYFVQDEKRKRGLLDFDDLLLLSRDLLKTHSQVRTDFQKKYRYLLIDEFQDTDPLQAEIIRMLASENDTWVPGKLFLVGDPKQSIYRFRRADIDTYKKTTNQIHKDGKHLIIRQNFRSSKRLVETFNQMFSKILGEEYEQLHPQVSHLEDISQQPIWKIEPRSYSGDERAPDVRRFEAEALASLLANEVIGKVQIYDKQLQRLRPAQAGDVAILFPTTTGIDFFEEQLRQFEIPFVLEGGRIFYHRSEVHGLLSLLDAIDHPNDPLAVVAALKSPFIGCSDVDLFELHEKTETFDYRNSVEEKKLNPTLHTSLSLLRTLHEMKSTHLPSDILRTFLEKSWAFPLTLSRTHGEQAVANIERFSQMILSLEKRGFDTLSKLVRWFRARSKEGEKQDESSLTDELDNRVHLMTIHKSKGLEFPVVILANLSTGKKHLMNVVLDRTNEKIAVGVGSKADRFSTDDFEELTEKEDEKLYEEKKRLLYVAATRSRDLLILPKFLVENKQSELWELLETGLSEWKEQIRLIHPEDLPSQPKALSSTKEKSDAPVELTPPSHAEKIWAKGLNFQTPSQLAHENVVKNENQVATYGKNQGAMIGTLVHEIFELLLENRTLSPSLITSYVCKMHDAADVKPEIEEMVNGFYQSDLFKRISASPWVETEVPFTQIRGDSIIDGKIDLVFEEDEKWVIVDYKTDRVKKENLKEKMSSYKPQLEVYSEAIQQFTKKPVKETLLYFVRLNEVVLT